MSQDTSTLSGWRSVLWPIHKHELKKFVPMLLMFFLICFNYNLLHITKDSLNVTAPLAGAEVIPFIKVWAMLPMAVLLTVLFSYCSHRFGREKTFYIIIGIFLSFFFIFTFVLYPLRDTLHPHQFANILQKSLPDGCHGLVALLRNWTFTAFYVMSELWSSIVMTVLFWGFANEVTSVNDAKRFYTILSVGANLAGIVAAQAAIFLANKHLFFNFLNDSWQGTITLVNSIVILVGVAILLLFRYLHRSTPSIRNTTEPPSVKAKSNLKDSFSYLFRSKYLFCIAIVVLSYHLSINLIEVIWKNQVKQLYPHPNDFQAYMGQVYTYMGILSTMISLFLTGPLIRSFTWTFSAMITPLIMLVTGIGFFAFLLLNESGIALGQASLLAVCVFFGSLQNCLARACKYTVFDTTKEVAFIPLSPESKRKGKAAIDGIGSRLGKSGGSLIHQSLIMASGSLAASAPFVASILSIVIIAWITAVRSLGKQFDKVSSGAPVEG